VQVENHAAGSVLGDGIGMCCAVVEEVVASFGGSLSVICLGRYESAQGYEHGGINGARVEEQSANDFLEAGDAGLV
jgi:hypothetical protein